MKKPTGFELKPLSRESIPAALAKAERYRLLNEPMQAESICEDVLEADPENQDALVMLLLALTDQFKERLSASFKEARRVLSRLTGEYAAAYYDGLICERRAEAQFRRGTPGSGYAAYHWFQEAMKRYEEAAEVHPPGNDDAVLRWNTCARFIMRFPEIKPAPEDSFRPMLE